MRVYERVAEALWAVGITQVFGVAGSGNYRATKALIQRGAAYVGARHEGGAVSMADAFSRMGDSVPLVSVHQGGGLTNLVTGLTEAAKSGSAMLILAGEAPLADRTSNFRIDQTALVEAVGGKAVRISAAGAAEDVREAYKLAITERVPVLLNFPVDVQMAESPESGPVSPVPPAAVAQPDPAVIARISEALLDARAPLVIGGRGARAAGPELLALAQKLGALTATSAVARGLFADDPFTLDVMGDLSSPITGEMALRSDVIIAFGCGLGKWTTSNGSLLPPGATLIQVDDKPMSVARHRPVDIGLVADCAVAAEAIAAQIPDMEELRGRRRTPATADRLAKERDWRGIEFTDRSADGRIDPRAATIALDGVLDSDRNIAVDSGNFLGYPSMFLSVPDARGLCFSQAFQCVGLGLASAIGHATALPDRLTIAACGDGGMLMGASELETVARLGLPMVILVYNDSAYGAEVHHFGRHESDDGFVSFPDVDFAAIARGYGLAGITLREVGDVAAVAAWAAGPRETALLVDIKVTTSEPSWWLADAFKAEQ